MNLRCWVGHIENKVGDTMAEFVRVRSLAMSKYPVKHIFVDDGCIEDIIEGW